MKKTYQNPAINVVMIQTTQMIATSTNVSVGGSYNGSSTIESRDTDDLWDDDEY